MSERDCDRIARGEWSFDIRGDDEQLLVESRNDDPVFHVAAEICCLGNVSVQPVSAAHQQQRVRPDGEFCLTFHRTVVRQCQNCSGPSRTVARSP